MNHSPTWFYYVRMLQISAAGDIMNGGTIREVLIVLIGCWQTFLLKSECRIGRIIVLVLCHEPSARKVEMKSLEVVLV